ncbi:MAG TPA: hypothetical protein VFA18_19050, partial [Gemmataceae bacterium]|nr:hypothetical protein [Gemmataceae bacterium]
MAWRRFVAWLTQLARTPFAGQVVPRRRGRRHRPQTHINVRQLEPIASPTSLTALPGAVDYAMLAPGWSNPELAAAANISVAWSTALAADTGSDGFTVTCGIASADPPASAGTIDVAAGINAEDTSELAIDDNDFASLNFADAPGMPASGAEPEVGAASGILAGVTGSGVSALGNTGWVGGVGTSMPIAPPAGPTGNHAPLAQMPSNSTVPSTTTTGHASHTRATTSLAAQLPSATPASTASGGGSSTATGSTATSQATPFLGPGPFITGSSGASIMPVVYDSTASDPAQEVVQVTGQAQGQNPMTQGFSQGGVRYADGTVQLIQPDLSSSGFASAWGQTRTWTNNTLYIGGTTSTNPAGNSWVVSQLPYLMKVNSGNTIDAIVSGSNAFIFDQNNGVWVARYFLQNTLVDNNTTHQFTLTDDTGRTITLMDFSSSVPASQQGTFVSLTDSYGNQVSVVSRNSSGQITEVQSSSTQGSTTVVESYLYTYISSGTNAGLLQNVTLRRKINSGSWSVVRQVAYTYYDGTTSYGNAGDLQTATIEDALTNTLATYYYRYYTSTGSGGYVHGLEYSFDPRSYARLAAAVSNPLTATNAQVAPYAQYAFQYDSSQ